MPIDDLHDDRSEVRPGKKPVLPETPVAPPPHPLDERVDMPPGKNPLVADEDDEASDPRSLGLDFDSGRM